jgi:hypothetical protein
VSKVLLGVISVLLVALYYFFNQNQILVANNSKLQNAVVTQEETIKTIQKDFNNQAKQLQDMTIKSQAAQRELNRYTQFIQNYQLTAKILSDPVEMERKINNGTICKR